MVSAEFFRGLSGGRLDTVDKVKNWAYDIAMFWHISPFELFKHTVDEVIELSIQGNRIIREREEAMRAANGYH